MTRSVTLGVDLAAQASDTAACAIVWDRGSAHVEVPTLPVADAELVEMIDASDIAGVDVPLGWPDLFIDQLVAYRDGGPWVANADDTKILFYRETDRWVHTQTSQTPLSVAADRIAWPAARAGRLLTRLTQRGIAVDRSGATGKVVEVYPAAALRGWASRWTGYKDKKRPDVLAALADELFLHSWLHFNDAGRAIYRTRHDAFDALIASLVARAHQIGQCEPIPDRYAEQARREGWIALPLPGSLVRLVES